MVDRQPRQKTEAPGYETTPINLRIPIGVFVGVIVGLPIALAVIWLFFHFVWKSVPGEQPYSYSRAAPVTPAPRLLARPGEELRALRIENRRRLNSYGWVDKRRGIVHIPIERAMQWIARHGFPPRPPRPKGHPRVPLYPVGTANKSGGGP